ncbi:class I SAM-dependent methyltransferase [soil metagenome]
MPPKRMRFMGEDDEKFKRIGDELLDGLEHRAGQGRESSVLDVGCGYGRLAHAMKRRGFDGSYFGFDVLKPQISWCQRKLGSKRFEFVHIDIGNGRYNPDGAGAVGDLDLGDRRFDVIAAFSVCTHLWPDDVSAYLRLAAEHLSPGGHFQSTFFLMDDEWRRLVASGEIPQHFQLERTPHCRYHSDAEPLHMVAYDLDWVIAEAARNGLKTSAPLYGSWSRRPLENPTPAYQDELTFRLA